MSVEQKYRYVSFDRKDDNLTQFYIREVNGALYLKLTRTDERVLARLQAADFSQEANPAIQIIDGENELGVIELLAPYDTDFGFRIAGIPTTPLVEDSLYILRPDWNVPVEYAIDPEDSRGWSPSIALVDDDNRIVMQITDWLAGRGPKPQTGYLGQRGLVSDIADAVDVRGMNGLRGSRWTDGDAFPTEALQYDQHIFSEAATIDALDSDGTTPITSAIAADIFNYNGTAWVKAFNLVESLGTSIEELQTSIERVSSLVSDMKLEIPPEWSLPTDAVFTVLDGATMVNAARINAVTNWNTSLTVPTLRTAFAIIRIPAGGHIGDYRISADHQRLLLNGLIKLTEEGLTGYDYYPISLNTKASGTRPGDTIILEKHGADIHTRYFGALVRERIIEVIAELLLPNPNTGSAGQVAVVNSAVDGWILADQTGGGGSAALTTQMQQTIANLVEKTLDLVITERPDWVLANATKAQFTTITRGSSAAQHLSNRQPPIGATGWTNDVTLTSTRVLVVRIKESENLSDYRFLFDQPPGVTLNFSALTRYASDTDWVYYGENTLTNESTGRIRLQNHGVDVSSRYIGDLSREKVLAALGNALLEMTPRRVSTMPNLLEGEVVFLTENDTSGGANYRKGTYQGVDNSGTIVPTQVLVPNQAVLIDALARLLPTFPAEDNRDGKIAKFNGNTLTWEVVTGAGISAAQIARLLPTLPATGSRGGKIAKFNEDALEWVAESTGSIPHFTSAAPEGNLGKIGDWHLNTDNGILSVKTGETTWNGRATLFTFFSFQHLLNRWQKERAADFSLTGNTTGSFNVEVQGSDSLLHASIAPATSLQTKQGTDIALQVRLRIARNDSTDGNVNVKIKNSSGTLTEFTSNIHSASQEIEIYSPVTRLINNTFVFEVTTTGFAAATVITISSVKVNLNEIPRIDTPRRVLSLPRPKVGNTVYLKDQAGANPKGMYHCFNLEDGYQPIDVLPPMPSTGQRNDKILKYDGDSLGWEDDSTTSVGGGQRWPAHTIPTGATSMSFQVPGKGNGVASLPSLESTNYQYSYYDVHGTTFVVGHGTANFNVNLADLLYINRPDFAGVGQPTDIDDNNRRDEVDGIQFFILNVKGSGNGNITFSAGGIATVTPSGGNIQPDRMGMIVILKDAGGRFRLVISQVG